MVGEETLSVWPGVKVGGWGDPLLPLKSNDIHCLPELELPTCDMGTPTVLSGLTAKWLDSSFSVQFLYCSLPSSSVIWRNSPGWEGNHLRWPSTGTGALLATGFTTTATWTRRFGASHFLSKNGCRTLEGRAILYVTLDKYLSLCVKTMTPYSKPKVR